MNPSPSIPEYIIGVMSGTSMDGVDAVLVAFEDSVNLSSQKRFRLVGSVHQTMPTNVWHSLKRLQQPENETLEHVATTAISLSELYAQVVLDLCCQCQLKPSAIAAIGVHGQTIQHRPTQGYSWQLIHGARLAEMTGICVITDFRNRDIAAGGQGAPLIPAFHRYLMHDLCVAEIEPLSETTSTAAFLNIGGMANLTLWQEGAISAADSGPGNILLDAWIQHNHPQQRYDANGDWAAKGALNPVLLNQLLQHPYFSRPLPKSCGYEAFNLDWLRSILQLLPKIAAQDIQTTLTELTAITIRDCIQQLRHESQNTQKQPQDTSIKFPLFVFGGGVYNRFLWQRLKALLPAWDIADSGIIEIPPLLMEATAFAWLAYQTLHGVPSNCPEVTGASGARVLGAIYPA